MKTLSKKYKIVFIAFLFSASIISFNACSDDDANTTSEEEVIIDDTDFEATDWTTETHSNDADPNFDEVFEDHAVKRLILLLQKHVGKVC